MINSLANPPQYWLLLAYDRFAMMTSHVIKPRPPLHNDSKTVLITLCIVGLARAETGCHYYWYKHPTTPTSSYAG